MNSQNSPAWTPSAKAELESWFARRLRADLLEGADPTEVRADLTMHLHEELTAAGVGTVTSEILAAALAKMGGPVPARAVLPAPRDAGAPGVTPAGPVKVRTAFRYPKWFLFLAVILPMLVWLFELTYGACAGLLFDPLPTAWHHLVVLSAPVAGWLAWRALDKTKNPGPRLLRAASWMTGAGLAASLFYAVLFGPFSHWAVLGIIFGTGLAALTPLIAFLALLRARVLLRNRRLVEGVKLSRPALIGALAMMLGILLLEGPSFITRIGIHGAARSNGDPEEVAAAVRLVRRFGSEAALLRACYDTGSPREFERAAPDPASWIAEWLKLDRGLSRWQFKRGWQDDDATTRDLYFRVTGVPFNSVPRPRRIFQSHGGRGEWDPARGGEVVAGQITGLSLAESRLDWHCESASGLTWGEWTFTFANKTAEPQEARCRIALPQDGFVSRVVLWVNGEPQEAAFGATPQVRAAYKSVAVVQRRDPVLVTQPDAGSIMLQAFPVPAGGTLKTRVTFTAPVSDNKVWLPAITERNFAISEQTRAALWIQSDAGTLASTFDESRSTPDRGWLTLTASPRLMELTGSGGFVEWKATTAPAVWCENPFAAAEQRILVRKNAAVPSAPAGAVAWVVDGSSAMQPFAKSSAQIIQSAGRGAARIFIAGDSPSDVVSTDRAADVESFDFAGGRDNTPALAAALDWLRGTPGATLVWLHGPQPVVSRSTQQIEQFLERSPQEIRVLDVPLSPGENNLLPVLTRSRHLRCRTLRSNPAAPLSAGFPAESAAAFTWEHHAALPADLIAVKVSDTLARQFALTEYRRLRSSDFDNALATAVKASLVTPDTGAVVLERAADYAANKLTQASNKAAQQVPILPEPSAAMLSLAAAALFATRRRRPQ